MAAGVVHGGDELLIFGETGGVYLTHAGGASEEKAKACPFVVELVGREPASPLRLKQPFLLRGPDGRYLQRTKPTPRPEDPSVHGTRRFAVGLESGRDQTWTIEACSAPGPNGEIAWNSLVGMTVAGTSSDAQSPNNTHRRYLTLRPDDPNVVVSWFQGHEHLQLHRK